ncbi:ATP-binding protein [Patescibacteria group bacterium]|nr:ATP-binding protein [Patescibacteria group bacterium]
MAKRFNKTDKVVIEPKEEFAYGYIIKALAGGLYPNKFHVIREYIQNAFDAVVNWKDTHNGSNVIVKITVKKPSIFIFDNGTGMNRVTLNEYRKVGYSRKKIGEAVGFRGIGKLAGISVARKLIVTTSPYGVKEKYALEFDAERMLKEIDDLKKRKQNIPLNTLIEKYTNISSDVEKADKHYTFIELHGIKQDSKILFDKNKLKDYISKNTPVPFDPNFVYGKEIEDGIKKLVDDYNCVNIFVDGDNIYKPYIPNLNNPRHIVVWEKNKTKILGYCWYCENKKRGQIKPIDKAGLVYRYKNFAVGDHDLPRRTLWDTSTHLAFYFIGEIYICDKNMLPTAQRDDFEQTSARSRFYNEGVQISKEINRIARASSGIRRALHYVDVGKNLISEVKQDLQKQEHYLKDLGAEKVAQIYNVIKGIKERKKNIPKKNKKNRILADKVVKQGELLLKKFGGVKRLSREYDITRKINLNAQAKDVYSVAIRTLKDFFIGNQQELEKAIRLFQKNLTTFFSKKNK